MIGIEGVAEIVGADEVSQNREIRRTQRDAERCRNVLSVEANNYARNDASASRPISNALCCTTNQQGYTWTALQRAE
ncbi:unnamed protein product [Caretta caretta]